MGIHNVTSAYDLFLSTNLSILDVTFLAGMVIAKVVDEWGVNSGLERLGV